MKNKIIKISDIVKLVNLEVICAKANLGREVKGGYVSDLLSDVMANSKQGDIWLTLQGHPNIVAVAVLKEIAGIIIVNGRSPDEETIKKATNEKLPIMTSTLPAFELAGKLYEFSVSGTR
jgi:predicted transcriptional regulator